MNSRVLAVALLLTATATATAVAADDKGKSWKGKTIILTEFTVQIVNGKADADGTLTPVATLSSLQYQVEDEEGDYIKVRENGVPGWFDKSKAVPLEEAVDRFTKMIEDNPNVGEWHNRRAEAYLTKQKYDDAIKDYNEALRLSPNVPAYLNNRGRAYSGKKDYDKAIKDFDDALTKNPRYFFALVNRGVAHNAKKDHGAAVKDYEAAIELVPESPMANNDLAWLRATCADEKFRDGKDAVERAKKACELSKFTDGDMLDTLAAAYAEAGNFDEAVKWQKKAIGDAKAAAWNGKKMRERLKLYEKKKPYRELAAGS